MPGVSPEFGSRILRSTCAALVACSALLGSRPVAADELTFTINDGRVTIVADNVTLDEILARWASGGQTAFVFANGDALSDRRLTLELRDVPAAEALSVLLRSASGYVARYRPAATPGGTDFEKVWIVATSRPAASSTVSYTPPADEAPGDAPIVTTMGEGEASPPPPGPSETPAAAGSAPRFAPLSPVEQAGLRLNRATAKRVFSRPAPTPATSQQLTPVPLLPQSAPTPGRIAPPAGRRPPDPLR